MIRGIRRQFNYRLHSARGRNIILTGVPRSGTTMLCRLLCALPNTVALNEPMEQSYFPDAENAKIAIANRFQALRKSLYFEGKALARTKDGAIVDNAFSAKAEGPSRSRIVQRTEVYFDKKLSPDFNLLMKHCAEFTLILPELTKQYTVVALMRNPLALLLSWRSVNVPVSRGRVAKSARLNATFYAALEAQNAEDLISKQLFILSWYFEQYRQLPRHQVFFYEDLVAKTEETLNGILDSTIPVEGKLANLNNRNTLYKDPQIGEVYQRLLASEGAYWQFYSKEQVSGLAQQIMASNG